jgi:O-antigen ligase
VRRGVAGAVLAAAAIMLLAFRDGGFEPASWRAAKVAFLAAAGLAAVLGHATPPTRAQRWLVLGLGAFAAWVALSAVWSPDSGASLLEAERAALYAIAVGTVVLVGGRVLLGTLSGIALVCAYSVGRRLVQGPPDPPDPFEGTLLHEPIGYANALGGIAAIGFAAAIVLVPRLRPRVVAPALCGLFLLTLALSGSRGGWIAALAGTAVAVPLALDRRRLAAGAAALAGLALVLSLALPAGSLADDVAEHGGGDRAWYWHVAWEDVAAAPIHGRGAGSFELSWLERQPVPVSVRDAHSLYLETLAELGVVGLTLLLLALAPPLVLALRASSAAAAGGYVAFLLHAGVDWDWELPAVTLAGLFCGVAALRRTAAQALPTPGVSTRSRPEKES